MSRALGLKLLATGCAVVAALWSSAPAQAADKTTHGDSCYLSAHWKVDISATWYGTDMQYVVMTSPGPLLYGKNTYHSTALADDGVKTFFGYFDNVTPHGATTYTYRANITGVDQYFLVDVTPLSYTHVDCQVTITR